MIPRTQQILDFRPASQRAETFDPYPPWRGEAAAPVATSFKPAATRTTRIIGFSEAAVAYCRRLTKPGESFELSAEQCMELCDEFLAQGSMRQLPDGRLEVVKR